MKFVYVIAFALFHMAIGEKLTWLLDSRLELHVFKRLVEHCEFTDTLLSGKLMYTMLTLCNYNSYNYMRDDYFWLKIVNYQIPIYICEKSDDYTIYKQKQMETHNLRIKDEDYYW